MIRTSLEKFYLVWIFVLFLGCKPTVDMKNKSFPKDQSKNSSSDTERVMKKRALYLVEKSTDTKEGKNERKAIVEDILAQSEKMGVTVEVKKFNSFQELLENEYPNADNIILYEDVKENSNLALTGAKLIPPTSKFVLYDKLNLNPKKSPKPDIKIPKKPKVAIEPISKPKNGTSTSSVSEKNNTAHSSDFTSYIPPGKKVDENTSVSELQPCTLAKNLTFGLTARVLWENCKMEKVVEGFVEAMSLDRSRVGNLGRVLRGIEDSSTLLKQTNFEVEINGELLKVGHLSHGKMGQNNSVSVFYVINEHHDNIVSIIGVGKHVTSDTYRMEWVNKRIKNGSWALRHSNNQPNKITNKVNSFINHHVFHPF